MGQRVVRVQDVEGAVAVEVEDARDDGQVVGGRVEQGVGDALGHMHLHGPAGSCQAGGHLVGEQMHTVPRARQGQGQLTRHDTRAPVGRVAEHAYPQPGAGIAGLAGTHDALGPFLVGMRGLSSP